MKSQKTRFLQLVAAALCLTSQNLIADTKHLSPGKSLSPPESQPLPLRKQAIIPEGKTLPQGVARVRIPFQKQQGDFGFDGAGKKTTSPFRASGTGSAFVLEYGISDRLSVQWLTRYLHEQSVLLDSQALEAEIFKKFGPGVSRSNLYQILSQSAAKLLAGKGACAGNPDLCLTAINQNQAIAPVDLNEANTGLPGLDIRAGQSIKEGLETYTRQVVAKVDGTIAQASRFEKRGSTGIGDSEIGLLFEAWKNENVSYAIGAGIRLPTGRCQDLETFERATGRCTVDAALRHNVDLLPVEALMLSWQHQAEVMLQKGTYSVKDTPDTFVGETSSTVHRKSPRHFGFLVAKPSLAPLDSRLAVVTSKIGVAYDYDSELVADAKAPSLGLAGQRSEVLQKVVGLGLDGTQVQIPAALETEYQEPWSGKNKVLTPRSLTTTLKVYFRF